MLDGAMGTMLQRMGAPIGKTPEELNITHPEIPRQIHAAYAEAGADIIYANTFGANRYKLQNSRYSVQELVAAGIRNAKAGIQDAAQRQQEAARACLVAVDIGSIGKLLEPNGDMKFEEAYDIYKEMIVAGAEAGADLVVLETSTDLLELKAGVLAAKENCSLPVIATMTFEKNGRTFTGVTVAAAAVTLSALGVDAVGINCSLGPSEVLPLVREMRRYTSLPIVVKPNAGLPNLVSQEYDVDEEEFAAVMEEVVQAGGTIIGGCCGTTPDYIRLLRNMLDQIAGSAEAMDAAVLNTGSAEAMGAALPNTGSAEAMGAAAPKAGFGNVIDVKGTEPRPSPHPILCSAAQIVQVDGVRVVGERINPTGKKRFKEALRRHDLGYIMSQALEQVQAGAHILDVNVGLPEIDEKKMMVDVIKELQAILDVPLQIDSSNPEVIEAALRVYNGKPLVNSVNGEQAVMDRILPLVKKYGAAVIGLTLDEGGIPDKAEDRFAIAERIVENASRYGIAREDVYIDCLTLTASVKQAEVAETLKAVSMVKKQLGVKTLLGVSNISFGLPNRELVNTAFLTMALEHGLDLPIMNPNNAAMMGAVYAFNVLMNHDPGAQAYVGRFRGQTVETHMVSSLNGKSSLSGSASECGRAEDGGSSQAATLKYAIQKGLRDNAAPAVKALLETCEGLEIVNEILIPALDEVGQEFEQGTIFLPQLLQSAAAAQAAFEVIKDNMAAKPGTGDGSGEAISKGKIILATVKGDIHDIGKNIVKVILENYGYDVYDLGKDVPIETVVEEARRTEAPLVGLSALMTTTVVNMEATIRALHEAKLPCRIMVGGAVLTPEYAKKIGADYYAKDAKQSADIAREVFGGI